MNRKDVIRFWSKTAAQFYSFPLYFITSLFLFHFFLQCFFVSRARELCWCCSLLYSSIISRLDEARAIFVLLRFIFCVFRWCSIKVSCRMTSISLSRTRKWREGRWCEQMRWVGNGQTRLDRIAIIFEFFCNVRMNSSDELNAFSTVLFLLHSLSLFDTYVTHLRFSRNESDSASSVFEERKKERILLRRQFNGILALRRLSSAFFVRAKQNEQTNESTESKMKKKKKATQESDAVVIRATRYRQLKWCLCE